MNQVVVKPPEDFLATDRSIPVDLWPPPGVGLLAMSADNSVERLKQGWRSEAGTIEMCWAGTSKSLFSVDSWDMNSPVRPIVVGTAVDTAVVVETVVVAVLLLLQVVGLVSVVAAVAEGASLDSCMTREPAAVVVQPVVVAAVDDTLPAVVADSPLQAS